MNIKSANSAVSVARTGGQGAAESAPRSSRPPAQLLLPPALRSWIDNVIVPALVREWLAENLEKHLDNQNG